MQTLFDIEDFGPNEVRLHHFFINFLFNIHGVSFMDFKIDKGVGYMYCYNPSHPLANKAGKVYEHRFVMSKHLGRWLNSDEVVHHKDGNRQNNDINNLELTNAREHAILHAKENGCVHYKIACDYCGKPIDVTNAKKHENRKFCSQKCHRLSRRLFEIDKIELEKLLWTYPTTHISKMLGVSDKAIEKRAKLFGLSKPPRGYWNKKK